MLKTALSALALAFALSFSGHAANAADIAGKKITLPSKEQNGRAHV